MKCARIRAKDTPLPRNVLANDPDTSQTPGDCRWGIVLRPREPLIQYSDVNKVWTCKAKDKDFTYSYLLQVAAKPTIAIKQH